MTGANHRTTVDDARSAGAPAPPIRERERDAAPVVSVRDVAIGWSPTTPLVEHASFEVTRGEIFGILGRSACGKSTLLRALVGLEPVLAGEVEIFGVAPDLTRGAPSYGVMFQHGALFGSLTLGENLALPLRTWTDLPDDAIEVIVRAKLRLVGLDRAYHQLPSTLSGGMRKRAAIARALTLEPALVFLDEPSSGLDPITSAEIDRTVSTLARALDLTVVVVTHELGSITTIVDRCVLMDGETKRLIAIGTPRELGASAHPRVRHFFERTPEDA
jgi:phospholipid/cholesterol/gamma-HCH transport system ATP-binding protein